MDNSLFFLKTVLGKRAVVGDYFHLMKYLREIDSE